jgi:hypothetical protein
LRKPSQNVDDQREKEKDCMAGRVLLSSMRSDCKIIIQVGDADYGGEFYRQEYAAAL